MKPLALALAVLLTAPAAAAADPLSIFQPGGGRAVNVTPTDVRALRALPALDAFGSITGGGVSVSSAASRADAAAQAGYAMRMPATLPAGVGAVPRFQVSRRVRATFTFSAAKAAAWAREHNVALEPVPDGLDGSTYTVALAPLTIATFGQAPHRGRAMARSAYVGVVQSPLPAVTVSGVPLATLAAWFARQPGIPPSLAAGVAAIGDPLQALPIPVFFDRQSAADVSVDGVHGLAIGDQTGLGSAVVWIKDRTLYAVGGTLTETDALALARALR